MRIWRKFIQMKLPNKDGCIVGIYLMEASNKILYCSVLFYAKSGEFGEDLYRWHFRTKMDFGTVS